MVANSSSAAAERKPLFSWCVGKAATSTKYEDDEDDARADIEASTQPYSQHQQELAATGPPLKPNADSTTSRPQAVFFVKMASSDGTSSGGASASDGSTAATTTTTGSDECSDGAEEDGEEVWYECLQEEEQGAVQALLDAEAAEAAEAAVLPLTAQHRAHLQALPASLSSILTKYLQGATAGCKPLVAVLRYMQDTHTSLQQLQTLLQPLLATEQHLPPPAPVPTARTTPAELTASLRHHQLQQQQQTGSVVGSGGGSSMDTCQQQHQHQQGTARLSHLLRNVQLAVDTLAVMSQQEGFRQVAHGPLEMWYCHDTTAKSQSLRARVVLEEPISVVVALAREVDLVPLWNPGMADMCELCAFNPTEIMIYLLAWMPWPLPQPELVNHCFGADLLDLNNHGCVLLHTSSADAPAGTTLPRRPRTMPLQLTAGGFRLVPLPPAPDKPTTPRTEVTVLATIDAARLVVPEAIISCVLKVFAPLVYKSVLKVLARMFHQTTAASAGARGGAAAQHSGSAQQATPPPPAGGGGGGGSTCSTSVLLERLALRPEYAALDVHAAKRLAAGAAAAGTAAPTAGSAVQAL